MRYVKKGYVRMPVVFAFAALGMVAYFADRRRNAAGLLLALAIGYMTLVPAMLEWPQDRYRLPVDAPLFMFAAWGLAAIVRMMTASDPQTARAWTRMDDAGKRHPQMLSDAPWIYADAVRRTLGTGGGCAACNEEESR